MQNFHATLSQRQRFVLIHKCQKRVNSVPFVISSMLKKVKSDLSNGDSGTTEPDILLEKLFEKTQKLEMMSSDSHLSEDAEQGLNLEISETDVEAAFSTLWKKEEDLKNAEWRVLQKLDQTKQDLEWWEKDFAATFAKQKQMEKEL
ncbi:unnamed protein product, partial [Musa acuminata var. zebrina]